ncbi:DUF86 domain-containing protein [Methanocalculus sp.]|uniref:HepT-like ribonuclease domain-containing protein n=1 Tax=Methanocalculus sp. TaxID=2004547 RepID=UPI00260A5B39|nr:DUF86 domain-containing protein [Methanocalculus sp.]MDG6250095.1 DUF86 domain-containing protein [Methanocalculus sp.]
MREEMDIHLLCDDILQATGKIRDYTRDMTYESFLQDLKTQDAVIRNLEIVGEAVKNLPKSIKEQYPEIPWRFISGMRDKLIHHYFGVSLVIVWETAHSDIPVLMEHFKGIKQQL